MGLISYKPIIQRIPTRIDRTMGITTFDLDNSYPQRMEELAARSPIVSSSIDVMQRFIRGDGFTQNGDLVVNRFGQTLNDILRDLSKDEAINNGWGLHININLLGGVTELISVKFKTIRLGVPDEFGRHYDIKTSLYWVQQSIGYSQFAKYMREFPLWDSRDLDTKPENISEFEGYIHYQTIERDEYPKCSFDAVADSAQTNAEIQTFELGSIQNSFLGTSIFKHPGQFESEKDRQRVTNDLHELTGSRNAGSVYMLEVPDDFEGNILENIPANNNDRLFELTNENVVERIMSRYAIPAPILGIQPTGGGVFNQDQTRDAYDYMNARTQDKRNDMVSAINKIMSMWHLGAVDVQGIEQITFNNG